MRNKLLRIFQHYERFFSFRRDLAMIDLADLSLFFLLYATEFESDHALLLGLQAREDALALAGYKFDVERYRALSALQKWAHVDPQLALPETLLSRAGSELENLLKALVSSRRFEILNGVAGIILSVESLLQDQVWETTYKVFAERLTSMDLQYRYGKGQRPFRNGQGLNLGLAHGLAGLLLAAIQLYEKTHFDSKMKKIVRQIADFLIQLDNASGGFHLPLTGALHSRGRGARFYMNSWCNGDAGIGYSLAMASVTLRDEALSVRSRKILGRALRVPREDAKGLPGNLCCGIAGLAQICLLSHRHFAYPDALTCRTWLRMLQSETSLTKGPGGTTETLHGGLGMGFVLFSYYAKRDLHWYGPLLGSSSGAEAIGF